ncbi:ptpA [Scenedesmus sp. PABB004]|nr:ptpA [Scenedesmus sp. PABB004]
MSDDFKAAFRAAQAQRGLAAKPTKQQLKALKAQRAAPAKAPAPAAAAGPPAAAAAAAPAGGGLPADFFDASKGSGGAQQPAAARQQHAGGGAAAPPRQQLAGAKRAADGAPGGGDAPPDAAVPKGFFDDRAADKKARGIKEPTAADKEAAFAAFAAAVDDELKQQAAEEDDDALEAAAEREAREAYKQQLRTQRAAELKALRANPAAAASLQVDEAVAAAVPAAPRRRRVVDVLQEVLGSSSDDDGEGGSGDDDAMFDWRAKARQLAPPRPQGAQPPACPVRGSSSAALPRPARRLPSPGAAAAMARRGGVALLLLARRGALLALCLALPAARGSARALERDSALARQHRMHQPAAAARRGGMPAPAVMPLNSTRPQPGAAALPRFATELGATINGSGWAAGACGPRPTALGYECSWAGGGVVVHWSTRSSHPPINRCTASAAALPTAEAAALWGGGAALHFALQAPTKRELGLAFVDGSGRLFPSEGVHGAPPEVSVLFHAAPGHATRTGGRKPGNASEAEGWAAWVAAHQDAMTSVLCFSRRAHSPGMRVGADATRGAMLSYSVGGRAAGMVAVDLRAGTARRVTAPPALASVHAALMVVCFALALPAGVLAARHAWLFVDVDGGGGVSPAWRVAQALLLAAGAGAGLSGLIVAVIAFGGGGSGGALPRAHQVLGIICVGMSLALAAQAVLQPLVRRPRRRGAGAAGLLAPQAMGLATLAAGWATLFLGCAVLHRVWGARAWTAPCAALCALVAAAGVLLELRLAALTRSGLWNPRSATVAHLAPLPTAGGAKARDPPPPSAYGVGALAAAAGGHGPLAALLLGGERGTSGGGGSPGSAGSLSLRRARASSSSAASSWGGAAITTGFPAGGAARPAVSQQAYRTPSSSCDTRRPWRASGGRNSRGAARAGSSAAAGGDGPAPAGAGSPVVVRVDGLVVDPAFRSTPWHAEQQLQAQQQDGAGRKALIMFVSESGIARAPLAAALFAKQLAASPLAGWVDAAPRATRDYCLGQPPHPAAVAAAAALGTPLDSTAGAGGALRFEPAADIVAADLVLVFDKYTAADVLREVSSYDLINPGGHYSARVRLLGSFHPRLATKAGQADAQDLDDALYGNVGGQAEADAVLACAGLVAEATAGLVGQLEALAAAEGLLPAGGGGGAAGGGDDVGAAARLREALVLRVRSEGVISWLVPPMLQGSTTDLGGWV